MSGSNRLAGLKARPKDTSPEEVRRVDEVGEALGFVDRSPRRKPGRKPSPRTYQLHPKVFPATGAAIAAAVPPDADAARRAGPLVAFSAAMRAESNELKRFLFANLYRHPQVTDTTSQAQQVVRDLFAHYTAQPQAMNAEFASRADTHRAVADYIAGMTDRFALREHFALTGQEVLPAP